VNRNAKAARLVQSIAAAMTRGDWIDRAEAALRVVLMRFGWQWSGLGWGAIVDSGTAFVMRDKVQHLLGGAAVAALYREWLPAFGPAQLTVFLVALLVELIEKHRYELYGWSRSFSDHPDAADLVYTQLGGLLAWAALAGVAWLSAVAAALA
jgi:hypothetical protein